MPGGQAMGRLASMARTVNAAPNQRRDPMVLLSARSVLTGGRHIAGPADIANWADRPRARVP